MPKLKKHFDDQNLDFASGCRGEIRGRGRGVHRGPVRLQAHFTCLPNKQTNKTSTPHSNVQLKTNPSPAQHHVSTTEIN